MGWPENTEYELMEDILSVTGVKMLIQLISPTVYKVLYIGV